MSVALLQNHAIKGMPVLTRLGRKHKGLVAVKHVDSPDPSWRPGQKQPHPFDSDNRLQLNPADLGVGLYPFVISSIVPRPIAFISSLSKEVSCGFIYTLSSLILWQLDDHATPLLI